MSSHVHAALHRVWPAARTLARALLRRAFPAIAKHFVQSADWQNAPSRRTPRCLECAHGEIARAARSIRPECAARVLRGCLETRDFHKPAPLWPVSVYRRLVSLDIVSRKNSELQDYRLQR